MGFINDFIKSPVSSSSVIKNSQNIRSKRKGQFSTKKEQQQQRKGKSKIWSNFDQKKKKPKKITNKSITYSNFSVQDESSPINRENTSPNQNTFYVQSGITGGRQANLDNYEDNNRSGKVQSHFEDLQQSTSHKSQQDSQYQYQKQQQHQGEVQGHVKAIKIARRNKTGSNLHNISTKSRSRDRKTRGRTKSGTGIGLERSTSNSKKNTSPSFKIGSRVKGRNSKKIKVIENQFNNRKSGIEDTSFSGYFSNRMEKDNNTG